MKVHHIRYISGFWNRHQETRLFGWALCGRELSLGRHAVTLNPKLVTCKRCLKSLGGDAE